MNDTCPVCGIEREAKDSSVRIAVDDVLVTIPVQDILPLARKYVTEMGDRLAADVSRRFVKDTVME